MEDVRAMRVEDARRKGVSLWRGFSPSWTWKEMEEEEEEEQEGEKEERRKGREKRRRLSKEQVLPSSKQETRERQGRDKGKAREKEETRGKAKEEEAGRQNEMEPPSSPLCSLEQVHTDLYINMENLEAFLSAIRSKRIRSLLHLHLLSFSYLSHFDSLATGLGSLPSLFASLQELRINNCGEITPSILQVFSSGGHVTSLSLICNLLPSLSLSLSPFAPTLSHLDLCGCFPKDIDDLCAALSSLSSLSSLSLRSCSLGPSRARAVLQAIQDKPMSFLDLSRNPLGYSLAADLGHCLSAFHGSLKSLDLSFAGLHLTGIRDVLEAFQNMAVLEKLELGGNLDGFYHGEERFFEEFIRLFVNCPMLCVVSFDFLFFDFNRIFSFITELEKMESVVERLRKLGNFSMSSEPVVRSFFSEMGDEIELVFL